MAIDYQKLPVYEQKQKILDCLKDNQVIIVESPTGSGKTTQIPVIYTKRDILQTELSQLHNLEELQQFLSVNLFQNN